MSRDFSFEKKFTDGICFDAYMFLGNHRASARCPENAAAGVRDGQDTPVCFAMYAPNAQAVRVVGDFNNWGGREYHGDNMARGDGGIWTAELGGLWDGTLYKYMITAPDGEVLFKNDPFAVMSELRPGTASRVGQLPAFQWGDADWLEARRTRDNMKSPVNIYELHLGSWRRGNIPGVDYRDWQYVEAHKADEPFLNYREIADQLAEYLTRMHYTHVELMPVCEHPLDGSWGYQTGNYYSVTSRYGTPEDFMYFVDRLHRAGLGVILDWVPGHFCKDAPFLSRFDGTYLYEPEAENRRENPLWGTANFDFGKGAARSFLASNACFWLGEYHVDGLRIDAVANMIYYDYNGMHPVRPRNSSGGFENNDAIAFLGGLNALVHTRYPGVITAAEDSSTYPGITAPPEYGGLGFDFKWNMGWMNDTLSYMGADCGRRRDPAVHNKLNFAMMYNHTERFLLPISHDETVHGKRTLLDKMWGPLPDKFAQLRTYLLYMMAHPGKKLLFMGSEFGQIMEWRYYEELEWKMLLYPEHGELSRYVEALNALYLSEPALYTGDYTADGFRWIDADNARDCVFSFVRTDAGHPDEFLLVVLNFSDRALAGFRLGVPRFCDYSVIFRTGTPPEHSSGEVLMRPAPYGVSGLPFNIALDLPAFGGAVVKPFFRQHRNGA